MIYSMLLKIWKQMMLKKNLQVSTCFIFTLPKISFFLRFYPHKFHFAVRRFYWSDSLTYWQGDWWFNWHIPFGKCEVCFIPTKNNTQTTCKKRLPKSPGVGKVHLVSAKESSMRVRRSELAFFSPSVPYISLYTYDLGHNGWIFWLLRPFLPETVSGFPGALMWKFPERKFPSKISVLLDDMLRYLNK